MSQYFPKSYEPFGGYINVKVDLSNYVKKKPAIKNISHIDTSIFALKSNLASLKAKIDKLDIEKLVPVAVDLSKLRDVVKHVVKKTVYNCVKKWVAKVNNIGARGFVLKAKYDADKTELEKKTHDISGLAKKADCNAKINGKMPSISGLATNTALTAVEIKIPNISSLVKKRLWYKDYWNRKKAYWS